jgi:hypothetical protein
MGIQNIPQTVSEKIESQDGDKNGNSGENADPGRRKELFPGG